MSFFKALLTTVALFSTSALALAMQYSETCKFVLEEAENPNERVDGLLRVFVGHIPGGSEKVPPRNAGLIQVGAHNVKYIDHVELKLGLKVPERQKNNPEFIERVTKAGVDAKLVATRDIFALWHKKTNTILSLSIWRDKAGKRILGWGMLGKQFFYCTAKP